MVMSPIIELRTSSVASSITTPTITKASALAGMKSSEAIRPWNVVAGSNAAASGIRNQVPKARPSNFGGSIASGMQRLNVNNAPSFHSGAAKPNIYNPSEGPPPPAGNRWGGTAVGTNMTADTYDKPMISEACHKSNRKAKDFKKGEVIALPYHVTNMNPNIGFDDPRVTLTCEGPAFSKRRMVVVLWVSQMDMFCLPLYSFEGKGLGSKQEFMKADYVCLKNKGAKFKNQGLYDPVVFESYNHMPLTDETTVHLTGGLRVDPKDKISKVGRLERDSHTALLKLWQDQVDLSVEKPWEKDQRR